MSLSLGKFIKATLPFCFFVLVLEIYTAHFHPTVRERIPRAIEPIKERIKSFKERKEGSDILVFGSSRAEIALHPSTFSKTLQDNGRHCSVTSFAMSGGTFEAADIVLRNFIHDKVGKEKVPQAVIYGFGLFELNDSYTNPIIARELTPYIAHLRRSVSKGLQEEQRQVLKGALQPILARSGLFSLKTRLMQRVHDGIETTDRSSSRTGRANYNALKGYRVGGKQFQALIHLVHMFSSIGTKVFIVRIPVLPSFQRHYDNEIISESNRILKIIDEETEAVVVDRSLAEYGLEKSMFADADHLNKTGAKLFSQELYEKTLTKHMDPILRCSFLP